MSAPEIIVVSNRLPVSWTVGNAGQRELTISPGGLVSAVSPVAERLGCTWIGWLDGGTVREQDLSDVRVVPVEIEGGLFSRYYEGFANQVLWPVFHGLPEFCVDAGSDPEAESWWPAYQEVNQVFATRIAETAGTGAFVWIHDYHLLLVPLLLRNLRPDLRVAVFLHIPFPALEVLAHRPWVSTLLRGVSAAHLVGVQREIDAVHLKEAHQAFAAETSPAIRAFPISIDAAPVLENAHLAQEEGAAVTFRARYGLTGRRVILGVDRLDYTKGITERIGAFAELLATWNDDVPLPVLLQVLTPTRENIPAYREYAGQVQEAIVQVRAKFAADHYEPIVTISTPCSPQELIAAFLAADVMCVSSLRDGMNLVAKEFVVSRIDEQGVLVLSRDAGAADEIVEALTIDPRDLHNFAATLRQALALTPGEAAARMRAMRARVIDHDVHHWAQSFLDAAGVHTQLADAVGGERSRRGLLEAMDLLGEEVTVRGGIAP